MDGGGAPSEGPGEAEFRAQFEAHADHVYAFLRRLCADRALADDLFQETWCSCARAWPRLDRARPLRPWLLATARNHWRMHRRWAWVDLSRWFVAEPGEENADEAAGPEGQAIASEAVRGLERAIRRLGDRDREALLLAMDESLTSVERARVLATSEAAYRQRLHRARRALERLLAEEEDR
jgi:RNA polymerase sigma-70 factor (ECF subfamily)